MQNELLTEAVAAFRDRADIATKALGGRSYKIRRISLNTGGFVPGPRPMMADRAMAAVVGVGPAAVLRGRDEHGPGQRERHGGGRVVLIQRGPPMRRSLVLALLVALVACANPTGSAPGAAGDPAALLQGPEWVVEDIAGKGIVDGSRATLNFGADGRLAGRGSCNNYFAKYTLTGEGLTISQAGATMMACAPAVMNQEGLFLEILRNVRRFDLGADGALVLRTDDGRTITARR